MRCCSDIQTCAGNMNACRYSSRLSMQSDCATLQHTLQHTEQHTLHTQCTQTSVYLHAGQNWGQTHNSITTHDIIINDHLVFCRNNLSKFLVRTGGSSNFFWHGRFIHKNPNLLLLVGFTLEFSIPCVYSSFFFYIWGSTKNYHTGGLSEFFFHSGGLSTFFFDIGGLSNFFPLWGVYLLLSSIPGVCLHFLRFRGFIGFFSKHRGFIGFYLDIQGVIGMSR